MGKVVGVVIGLLLFCAGAIFTFQGLGYVGGSAMTGSSFWAIAGPIIAGLGLALAFVAAKGSSRP